MCIVTNGYQCHKDSFSYLPTLPFQVHREASSACQPDLNCDISPKENGERRKRNNIGTQWIDYIDQGNVLMRKTRSPKEAECKAACKMFTHSGVAPTWDDDLYCCSMWLARPCTRASGWNRSSSRQVLPKRAPQKKRILLCLHRTAAMICNQQTSCNQQRLCNQQRIYNPQKTCNQQQTCNRQRVCNQQEITTCLLVSDWCSCMI